MPYTVDLIRNEMFCYALGLFRIRTLVECGTYEGESLRYYGRFCKRSVGCDLDEEALARGRARGGDLELVFQDSLEFLKSIQAEEPAAFYLDSNWRLTWPGLEEIKIIKERWQKNLVIVNDVGMTFNPWFYGRSVHDKADTTDQTFKELVPHYRQILLPDYTVHRKTCGYVILNNFDDLLPEKGFRRLT